MSVKYDPILGKLRESDEGEIGNETDPVFSASEAANFVAGDKAKLDGIAAGAEVNVQPDWNAETGDAAVQNKPAIPDQLSDLSEDTTHRTVTDTEKSTWNGKQAALGYTAESAANKIASFQETPDDTHYPSEKLVKDNIDLLSDKSFYAETMTVDTGTLDTGVVGDLNAVGGTDVNISEATGSDPLRVTFDFSGITNLSALVFYGYYAGGSGHQMSVEIYNHGATTWDIIGTIGTELSKRWYSFPIYNTNAYVDSGAVSVRLRHIQSGIDTHDMIIDYLELNYGGAGGSANISASSVTFVPTGNIAATNVASALAELDNEKAASLGADDNYMTDAEKTKLEGIESGAEVNNISDVNATDLTDGGETSLHSHPGGGGLTSPQVLARTLGS